MDVKVWGSADRVEELLKKGMGDHQITVNGEDGPDTPDRFDLFIDLNFDQEDSPGHEWIPRISHKPALINTICTTVGSMAAGNGNLFGFNSWPTFINRPITETSLPVPSSRGFLDQLMTQLGWKYTVVEDRIGMVTPRIVAMIINEAYFTAGDGTAALKDIDTAMRLGTRYPYGPFEWAEKIGLCELEHLLETLWRETGDNRYQPAPLLSHSCRDKKSRIPD